MEPLLVFVSACLLAVSCSGESEQKELIMLEIEPLGNKAEGVDKVKRASEPHYGTAPGQFVFRADESPQQAVPPEYLSLLNQLSAQQGSSQQSQDIQQLFVTRDPGQSFAEYSSQPQRPPPRRLTPAQEEQRRLQESNVQKHIREQQQRSLQRQYNQAGLAYHQTQGSRYPQPVNYQPPASTPQPQPTQPTYQFQPQPQVVYQQPQYEPRPASPPQYEPRPASSPQYEPQPASAPQYQQFAPEDAQYIVQQPGPQYSRYETPQSSLISPEESRSGRYTEQLPQKFSYSQVHFGTSEIARESLEPRLASIQKRLQNYPKVQQVAYNPPPTDGFVHYQRPTPQQHAAAPPQTPTVKQHPDQYLIETTKPEQNQDHIVTIPRPRAPPPQPKTVKPQQLYYKPTPPTYDEQALYQLYQQSAVAEVQSAPPTPLPSRSSIFVTTSGRAGKSPEYYPQPYNQEPQIVIPTPQGQRPLTQTELNALVESGFSVSPLALSQKESFEISPTSATTPKPQFYRSSGGKRQSKYVPEGKSGKAFPKRVPRPVILTEDERKLLAEQGIRNLYRVESAESQEAPVTYVLALDNSLKGRESTKSV